MNKVTETDVAHVTTLRVAKITKLVVGKLPSVCSKLLNLDFFHNINFFAIS